MGLLLNCQGAAQDTSALQVELLPDKDPRIYQSGLPPVGRQK